MYGLVYSSQIKPGMTPADQWIRSDKMSGNFNPYTLRAECGTNIGNHYVGPDTISKVKYRSLMGQFSTKDISQRFDNLLL